jgi:hypothetical protein
MAEKRESPYVTVKWLSQVMAGDQACLWASWFRAHHKYQKAGSDFNLARWQMDHTRLLTETRLELGRKGARVSIERQNELKYRHAGNVTLAGTPDIVAYDDATATATVIDCKTGKPQKFHSIQVQIYMYLLPICFPKLSPYTIRGRVHYSAQQVDIPPVDADFVKNLDYYLELITSDAAAGLKAPSMSECRFCDITRSDCPERVELEQVGRNCHA